VIGWVTSIQYPETIQNIGYVTIFVSRGTALFLVDLFARNREPLYDTLKKGRRAGCLFVQQPTSLLLFNTQEFHILCVQINEKYNYYD